jgi:hypothetical protein
MAYLPERNLLILEIPKAASRSLVYAATDKGQRILPAQGHMPIAELFHAAQPAPHPTVIGLIRDPAARFVSALNYRFTTTRKHQTDDLDVAMQYALRPAGRPRIHPAIRISQQHPRHTPHAPAFPRRAHSRRPSPHRLDRHTTPAKPRHTKMDTRPNRSASPISPHHAAIRKRPDDETGHATCQRDDRRSISPSSAKPSSPLANKADGCRKWPRPATFTVPR